MQATGGLWLNLFGSSEWGGMKLRPTFERTNLLHSRYTRPCLVKHLEALQNMDGNVLLGSGPKGDDVL